MNCIYCRQSDNFTTALDLGKLYQSHFIASRDEEANFKRASHKLLKCTHCGFIQLAERLPLDSMFREYFYRSGLNKSMVEQLRDIANSIIDFNGYPSSVLDIGANDCTYLGFWDERANAVYRVGFDPANNLKEFSVGKCDLFINDYFDVEKYKKELAGRQFDAITSVAMFYDLENPQKFVKDIASVLSPDGVWICQMTDLTSLLRINAWDSVGTEHIAYWTMGNFISFVKQFGLEVTKVTFNDTNGGSVRYFVQHAGKPVSPEIEKYLRLEAITLRAKPWPLFNHEIGVGIGKVTNFLIAEKAAGRRTYVLGASTKGNTYLQRAALDEVLLPYAVEVSSYKFGKLTLGSNCYIISEDQCEAEGMMPDNFLVLPWHFKQDILANTRYRKWLADGVNFIFPLPVPTVVNLHGETYL